MKIGVDYYPEHWDREMWEEDAKLMQQSGVKVARLAEFAWSKMESEEGKYDFEWLDEAVDTLYKHGISVLLCTTTCTPPNWLVEKYPDVLPINAKGEITYPGVRGHRCANNPDLRTYTAIFMEKMTKHYSNNPAIIGWQIDNELWSNECHCKHCTEKFRGWLKDKYGTLENINREWGTIVWSGEYSAWSQVNTPIGGSPHQNPSFLLDFKRFSSASTVDFSDFQVEIIRKNCPNHFVTHNMYGYPFELDYYKLFEKMDIAALDYYPDTKSDDWYGAVKLDLARGVKEKNFWIMETLSGPPGCWFPMWKTPYPGMIRAYGWQCISRGADAVVQFRWRSATIGAEQFWHGLIDHSNVPGRRFKEFSEYSSEVNRLSALIDGSTINNKVAILNSHEQYTALKLQPQSEGMDFYETVKNYHMAFTRLGVGVDVLSTEGDISKYSLVVIPQLYLLNEEMAVKIEDFVKNGGTVVITNRTGVKNMNNVCWMKQLPGLLANCVGAVVEEYDPIGSAKHTVRYKDSDYSCREWCDIISAKTAESIAEYADDYYAGSTAITKNSFGAGTAYYMGTNLLLDFYVQFFKDILIDLNIEIIPGIPAGVEFSIREKDGTKLLFIINLTKTSKEFTLQKAYKSILNESLNGENIKLPPYAVEIVELVD